MRCTAYQLAMVWVIALVGTVVSVGADTHGIQVTGVDGVVTSDSLGPLVTGGARTITITLADPTSLDLRVHFAKAPFSGTRLDVEVNGTALVPYFAFGGDIRYDNVRGMENMRPPIATMEGRWLIPADLLQTGENQLKLSTTGVLPSDVLNEIGPAPLLVVDRVTLCPADGGMLPNFANSIYYDFAVWPQGYAWGRGGNRRFYYDNALLGVINGNGMPNIIPGLGTDAAAWNAKRTAEELWLDWGFRDFEFYTIWSFCGEPDRWAKFIDVDGDPDTQSQFHKQTIFRNMVSSYEPAQGADVLLYDIEKWKAALEPAIRHVAPYTNYYNVKCEQHGPWGQGFGDDGQAFADNGYDGDVWASNYYEAMKTVRDLVQKYDPEDGRVEEQNHWIPSIRAVLFDTALRRGQPMAGMIDILTTHFGSLADYDMDANGHVVPGETLHLQFPTATRFQSGKRKGWINHVAENGVQWIKDSAYPETAIDFNRYRLSRCEADMKLADPETHRWGNGKPFDYRAGFRGDEFMYNSENGIWQGYSAPSPYQYLQGMFAYSLLPTGQAEPRDLSITTRQSITETSELNVNLYGHWIDGAGYSKRLRTVDPLYGDMFGWTGNEHCNFGDYINMVGIKDHHHRQEPYNAFGLVRRQCYAFLTTGTLYPSWLGDRHDRDLFSKTLVQQFEGRTYLCVYAANFANTPQTLDVVFPLSLPDGGIGLVYDEQAWDWAIHEKFALGVGPHQRVTHEVAPLGAWMMAIPLPGGALAASLGLPAAPWPNGPEIDEHVTEGKPVLRFESRTSVNQRQQIEVAREARFRLQDQIELSEPAVMDGQYELQEMPQPGQRLWWRVRAIDKDGRGGPWSVPEPFIYAWPEYARKYAPQQRRKHDAWRELPTWDWLDQVHETDTPNLAWQGEVFGSGGKMNAPSRAADGQADSSWRSSPHQATSDLPAEWAVIWPQPQSITVVKILWDEEVQPSSFSVQISDDAQEWTDLMTSQEVPDGMTSILLDKPVSASYLRIKIPAAVQENGDVGIREVLVQ